MAPLIGRLEAQLVLRGRLKLCCDGRRGVVLFSGEAGVGKSRLLEEERGYAELLGMHVLAGRADEQRAGRPFVPLRSALDASLRAEQDVTLRRLAQDVDQQLRYSPRHETARSEPPAHVARSVTRLVSAWARRGPVVLMIDDLQAADRDTCDLLGQLPRQLVGLPLLVVAAAREPAPPHVAALINLWDRMLGPDMAHAELGPLDRHDALALVRSLSTGELNETELEDIVSRSGGNPLLLEEGLAASRSEQPQIGSVGGEDEGAEALLLRRLHRLHPQAVPIGEVIALFERPRPALVALVVSVTGCDESEVAQALDALTASGILRLEDGVYQFVLPAVRRTLVHHLGPTQRWQLHRVIANHFLARRAADEPVDLVELAPHLAASAAVGDTVAIDVLLEVAARFADHAPQSASDWYQQALALMTAGDPRRASALASRARVLFLAARLPEAVSDGLAALEHAAEIPIPARTGTIVLAAMLSLGRISEAVDTAERLEAASTAPLPRVQAQRAGGLNYLNRFAESRALVDAVLAGDPDPTTAALAHGVQAQVALSAGSTTELFTALDAAYHVSGLPEGARLSALTNDATHSVLACHLTRARAALAQARALADSLGAVAFDADLELTELMLAWRVGSWQGLDDRIARSLAELEGKGQRINLALLAGMRLDVLTTRGDLRAAGALDAALDARGAVGYSFVAWAQAGYRLAHGDAQAARGILAASWEHDRAVGRVSSAPLLLSRLVEVELALGEDHAARGHAEELCRLRASHGLDHFATFDLRAQGLVTADVPLLREAAVAADDEGMPLEAAIARFCAGRLSLDPELDLLPALHGFAALNAEGPRRQVAAVLRSVGVSVPRATRQSARGSLLTDAELRLARLVQDGLSNKQIASALALSPKTIEVYLSRVFDKTGVRSRVELAVALSEGRFVPQE